MGLDQYHKKRDFHKSPEPKGKASKQRPHLFVVQKHAARQLHYDFRLELHGVLKSWAVPKGPSLDPKVKRLAIQVEDHPIAYGSFEGTIPKGEYGGGTVMLWDRGTWEPLDDNPEQAYERGHLRFMLHADKLHGRWDLLRFKDEKNWFLIKYKDAFAKPEADYDVTERLDKSIFSHKCMDQITQKKKIAPRILLPQGLPKSPFPGFIAPQLATLVDLPPDTDLWVHEVKFDGYRILAFKKGDKVILKSRNNKVWTDKFPSIVRAIQNLPIQNIILDGEIVVLNQEGRSDFQLLQNAMKTSGSRAVFVYFLFDVLYCDHFDLRKETLLSRKNILNQVVESAPPPLQYSDHIVKKGRELLEFCCQKGLEGIVSKQKDSPYLSKRTKNWLKIKCINRQEFVIGGYTDPKGLRGFFGSLFLGVFDQEGAFNYVGNVGTGFTKASGEAIYHLLEKNPRKTNPFSTKPPGAATAHWVKPTLVCEVAFTEWTDDKHLRHPSFKGMRLDKEAKAVIRETAKLPFVITNPDKILYPEDKICKEDLLRYYDTISDYILPFLINRPLTLLRCPKDYKKCFYQRHFNTSTPLALHAIDVPDQGEPYLYLNDKAGLLSLVQMGILEIHPWGSTIADLEKPDILIFDLDPAPDLPWERVVAAAFEVRNHLSEYGLRSFVKTTGGKGLHVVVPIKAEYDWSGVKNFSHVFVQFLERLKPDDYVSTMSKEKRRKKIFIDYLRNQRAATAIGTYSTRARIHAPVSTPLAWEELEKPRQENSYTVCTIPERVRALKQDPWEDFWKLKQSLRIVDN